MSAEDSRCNNSSLSTHFLKLRSLPGGSTYSEDGRNARYTQEPNRILISYHIKISLLWINDPKQKTILEEIMRKQLPLLN